MTPALTSFDSTMGCEKRLSWELKSATTLTTLSIQDSAYPATSSYLWDDLYDEEAETSSFTSSSIRSTDDLGASTSTITTSPTTTNTTNPIEENHDDSAQHETDTTKDLCTPTKKKKVVSFDPIAMMKCVEKISEEDSKKVWYSPLEMILLRKECIFTLWFLSAEDMSLSDPSASCSERYSIRGLEAQRDQIRGRQALGKYEALRVVLQEQEYRRQISKAGPYRLISKQDIIPLCNSKKDYDHRNHDDDIPNNAVCYYYRDSDKNLVPAPLDDEALAGKYAKASDPSKQSALLQAFEDEQVVKMMPYEHPTSKHHRYLFRFL